MKKVTSLMEHLVRKGCKRHIKFQTIASSPTSTMDNEQLNELLASHQNESDSITG